MSLKQFVNTPDVYRPFLEFVEAKIKLLQSNLEVATEEVTIYRLQGQILSLRRLLSMREEVNGRQ